MDARFPGVREVRASYQSHLARDVPVLVPEPSHGVRPAWGTLGAAIDHRLRYALASEVRPGGATIGGIKRAARLRQDSDGQGQALFELGKAVLGDLMRTVHTHRPSDRTRAVLLPAEVEEHLVRCCYAAAWFEEVFRSHRLAPSTPIGAVEIPSSLDGLLATVPAYAVRDVMGVVAVAAGGLAQVRRDWGAEDVVVGPTFDGSAAVGGADGDWIAGRTLVDVKATVKPRDLDLKTLYQLLGYVLLDFSDAYQIDEVGIYAARAGVLVTWPLDQFVRLAGASASVRELRREMQAVVSSL